jgi:hypothetical protein
MDRRGASRRHVLMSATIEFGGATTGCVVRNMSISGAALDVTSHHVGIPEQFMLVFKADGVRIPCRIVWRKDEQIGVEFD